MNALTEYQRIFPEHTPSCFQQDLLEQTVTNLPAWRKTLMFWASNAYRPQSIGKMLEYYEKQGRIAVCDSPERIVEALHRDFLELTNPTLSHIAVLQTLIRRRMSTPTAEPITSYKYFAPEARQLHTQAAQIALTPASIEAVLQVRLRQYASK